METAITQKKLTMFDQCVQEIEMLIYVSVLTQFYESDEFKKISERRQRSTLTRTQSDGDMIGHMSSHMSIDQSYKTPADTPWTGKMSQSANVLLNRQTDPERPMRGYAKRMLSIYDSNSKQGTPMGSKKPDALTIPLSIDSAKTKGISALQWQQSNLSNSPQEAAEVDSPFPTLQPSSIPYPVSTDNAFSPEDVISLNCISSEFLSDDLVSPLSPVLSPRKVDHRIRRYKEKIAQEKGSSTPTLIMSQSTESAFCFEFETSAADQSKEPSSCTASRMAKNRSNETSKSSKTRHTVRRCRSRSITNSPRVQSPKSSTHRSNHLLSPSCSAITMTMDRFHPIGSGVIFAMKDEKENK